MLKHEEMIENVHRRIAQYEEEKKMKRSKLKNIFMSAEPDSQKETNNKEEYTELVSGTENISSSNRMIRMISSAAAACLLITGIGVTGYILHKNRSQRPGIPEEEIVLTEVTGTKSISESSETTQVTETVPVQALSSSVSPFGDMNDINFNFYVSNNYDDCFYSDETYDKLSNYLNNFNWGEGKEITEDEIPDSDAPGHDRYSIYWHKGDIYFTISIKDYHKAYFIKSQCVPAENGNYDHPILESIVYDIDYNVFDKDVQEILSKNDYKKGEKLSPRDIRALNEGEFLSAGLSRTKDYYNESIIPDAEPTKKALKNFLKTGFPSMMAKISVDGVGDAKVKYVIERRFKSSETSVRWETYSIYDSGIVALCSYEIVGDEHIPTGYTNYHIDFDEFETMVRDIMNGKFDEEYSDSTENTTSVTSVTQTAATTTIAVTEPQENAYDEQNNVQTPTEAENNEDSSGNELSEEAVVRAVFEIQHNGIYEYDIDGTYKAMNENGELVDYKDEVNLIISRANNLPVNRELGSIADEQDAINKGRELLLNLRGQEYIDYHEKEYVEHDGKKEKIYRDKPFYSATYYEEYDIWYFHPNSLSGQTESGVTIVTPGTVPYFYIRGCDGKVLASYN